MLTSVSLCDMMEDLLGLSVTVSRCLSVNLEVLYVDFSHPKPRLGPRLQASENPGLSREPRLQASENPGLSREPREAGVTACDGLGYLWLGMAGLGLEAEASTSLTAR